MKGKKKRIKELEKRIHELELKINLHISPQVEMNKSEIESTNCHLLKRFTDTDKIKEIISYLKMSWWKRLFKKDYLIIK
tara:strand:- start:178 stop:414 length:237 start_codon:yes stop_codon:yes gene_type:complete